MQTKSTFAIYHDLVINATIEKLYAAVSEPTHLVNWWPKKCTGNPVPHEAYNLFFGEQYNWFGVVAKAIPNQSFHIKMTQADPEWEATSFGFDLEQLEHGISLMFRHVGWPECNAHFRHSSFYWALLLNGLKNYVEKGEIIPFEERG